VAPSKRLTRNTAALTKAALKGPYRFEITANQVAWRDPGDVISQGFEVFLAIEEITKDVYAEVAVATPENAAGFLSNLVAQSPEKIIAVATDILPTFTDWRAGFNENMAVGSHPFAVACRAHGIVHTQSVSPHAKSPKIRPRGVEIR
jgi:hypothetical protein